MRFEGLAASALLAVLVSSPAFADPPPAPAAPAAPVTDVRPQAAAWPPPGVVPLPAPPAAPAAAPPVAAPAAAAPATPVAPAAAPEKKHGPRQPGVMLLVLGAAGLGAGTIFGAIATATGAAARSQCVGTVCPPSAAPDIAKTKSFQASSYAAFAAGGVIAAAGLALTLVAPGDPSGDEGSKSARLAPWVGPGSGGVGFAGTF